MSALASVMPLELRLYRVLGHNTRHRRTCAPIGLIFYFAELS